ncbi:Ras association domain-containing protein 7 [Trichinella britovi]|uniref:Ras association domain-containing protein 7 n=1 Tax=Trichinella britovi TaxID=45882 RepID=A0A0V1CNR9_TRIBR|nr:Ras association domain-containing protein 7 [Trichinella britovi]
MELTVWIDGYPRVISNLTAESTCQEVIYSLAQSTGKSGRFVLVEKRGKMERSLAPTDRLTLLTANSLEQNSDIQYLLYRIDPPPPFDYSRRVSSTSSLPRPLPESSLHPFGAYRSSLCQRRTVSALPVPTRSTPPLDSNRITKNARGEQCRAPPPSYEQAMQSRAKNLMRTQHEDSAEILETIKNQAVILQEQQEIMNKVDQEIVRWLQRKEFCISEEQLKAQIAEREEELKKVIFNVESFQKQNIESQNANIRVSVEKLTLEIRAATAECQRLESYLADRTAEAQRLQKEIEIEQLHISNKDLMNSVSNLDVGELQDQIDVAEETKQSKLAICEQLRFQLKHFNMETLGQCLNGLKLLQKQSGNETKDHLLDVTNSISNEALQLQDSQNSSVWV